MGTRVIAAVNGVAAVLHALFWGLVFTKLPSLSSSGPAAEQANLGTVYGFGIADLVWSVPLLAIGSVGLWQQRTSGWLAAWLANGLYWYSFTVVLTRDAASGAVSPGAVLFGPFALFSFWAAWHLWRVRGSFA